MKSKETESNSSEPYFYIALVLKGTEEQYVNLLKYVNKRNGSKVIYQCKSLTYLHVTKSEGIKITTETPSLVLEVNSQGGNAQ